jgi:hypothetical protein
MRLHHILAAFSHSSLVSHRFCQLRFAKNPRLAAEATFFRAWANTRTGPETVVLMTAQESPLDTSLNHIEKAGELQG